LTGAGAATAGGGFWALEVSDTSDEIAGATSTVEIGKNLKADDGE
jgi:hypothetical protein